MLKAKRTSLTTRDLPAARKPDPNFKPYGGPSITTANYQKFKKSPVVLAEEVTEVPIEDLYAMIDAADEATAILEKVNAKIDAEETTKVHVKNLDGLKVEGFVYDGICNGITKAGNRCKRSVLEGTDFCPSHQAQEVPFG